MIPYLPSLDWENWYWIFVLQEDSVEIIAVMGYKKGRYMMELLLKKWSDSPQPLMSAKPLSKLELFLAMICLI